MDREVNLTERVITARSKRYCPVVLSANGRVKADAVLVNGKEERHSKGAYYVESRAGTTRIRRSVGNDAQEVAARRLRTQAELNARNLGVAVISTDGHKGRK